MKSQDVRIRSIQVNKLANRKKSYTVRWLLAGKPESKTFATRALADSYRSDLMQAVNRGEAFDTDSGLPESMMPTVTGVSWLAFVRRYLDMKWPGAAAKSRESLTDALATVTPALTADLPGRPNSDLLRRALRGYELVPATRTTPRPDDVAKALQWLERASLPLADLAQASVIRPALNALTVRLDGRSAAATTSRRKRAVFYNVLQYAVELQLLDFNPVDKLRVSSNRSKVSVQVDRRVVVNPAQARELLTAVTYVGSRGKNGRRGERLRAFFACMYFAGLRPGEATDLRRSNCKLPATGWGSLIVERSRPAAGKRYTDSGEVHDDRGLKHRGQTEAREVPIPPELVAILREHLERFGTDESGRLFRSTRGGVVSASSYARVWDAARTVAFPPERVRTPLAGRPYDLRHAGVSLWLNAGVPATDVADRAGHSVDVLLKVYAKCLDGDRERFNARIEAALDA
ncbi:site-specific recombinase XerD [Actinoplanes teichomyceticus]|uniref:Site-specific recombinase XerD n=1 Tax=Actinoplanes teichomyceticus TaxID=1867 RepID=A0A561VQY1_ACTTI|nr:site-specific recombinase XerD [Actinoplanes teichomyceticus]GIF16758.1 integrase [Actinoplanes teichomyceticus]